VSILDWVGLIAAICGLLSFVAIPAWGIWDAHRHDPPFVPNEPDPYLENPE
jgi:hypothetical protein